MALDTAVIYTRTVYTGVVYTPEDYTAPDCTEVGQTEVDTRPGCGTMGHGYTGGDTLRQRGREGGGRVSSSVFNQLSVIMRRMEVSKEASWDPSRPPGFLAISSSPSSSSRKRLVSSGFRAVRHATKFSRYSFARANVRVCCFTVYFTAPHRVARKNVCSLPRSTFSNVARRTEFRRYVAWHIARPSLARRSRSLFVLSRPRRRMPSPQILPDRRIRQD